ncbi:MAG TPA: OB-fold domain-containing protein [Terriglobales bacterium]|nr:OB-fold domain-containing protein [Terriglobales bacterium]
MIADLPLPEIDDLNREYWRAARNERLVISRCQACGWYVHPPKPLCPKCRGRRVAFEPVSGKGTVYSFTVNVHRWRPGMEEPFVIALVELREQPGLRMVSNITNCAIDQVRVGMEVQVSFRGVNDEIGLPVFEPVQSIPGQRQDLVRPAQSPPPSASNEEKPCAIVAPFAVSSAPQRLERKAIISGVGQSEIGRRLFRDEIDLTAEAALRAIADAGLTPADIDGIACHPGIGGGDRPPGFAGPGLMAVREALGLSVNWHLAITEGGGQISPVVAAALAIAAGLCRHALVYRTTTEGSAQAKLGGHRGAALAGQRAAGEQAFLLPYGAMSPVNRLALYATRYMHEYGVTRQQLAALAVACRRHAALNPAAIYRDPITTADYLNARMISHPLCLLDCDVPCDGATAVVVSTAEYTGDTPKPAVSINAVGTASRSRASWEYWPDMTTMSCRDAAAQMWSRTDFTPADLDVAQVYDGFSIISLMWIEALGLCDRGEAAQFIRNGRIELGGQIPLNTWGGQLSGGRLHGWGHLAEAIRQLRGECGPRQVENCRVAAVAVGGGPICGCMLLTRD